MGRRSREHRERVEAGLEAPWRNPGAEINIHEKMLKCNKCGVVIPEHNVTNHLLICQPMGAKCGWCGEVINPRDFMSHFNSCNGRVVAHAST